MESMVAVMSWEAARIAVRSVFNRASCRVCDRALAEASSAVSSASSQASWAVCV